ncbi:MAG: cyclopropane-fatty-acyl-phospholipid synthase family protein [Kiloniellaceae bacterium]
MLLAQVLKRFITRGELTVIDAAGRAHRIGDPETGPSVTIRLHDRALHRRLLLNPRLAVGEAYMAGTLTVENGSVYDFLDLYGLNTGTGTMNALDRWWTRARLLWRRFQQANPLHRARDNVAHHYDLSPALYELFLDRQRQYSCAYFRSPSDSLDQAQENKLRHIAAKLCLDRPGLKVLDIGCGWGGMSLHLAKAADAQVTGITLSSEQHDYAVATAAVRGLAARTEFQLCDYRQHKARHGGRYDRIVSVGMFEHVGTPNYDTFFRKLHDLLADDGVALLHTISHMDAPYPTNPWLQKYIFPGGYAPALSEILPAIEAAGLWVTDVEILRLHYAETLRHWRERFLAKRDEAARLYDERFCRMWEFYLAASEMTFRRQGHMVAQIQLAKAPDAVPLTRDYIGDWEQAADHAPAARLEPGRRARLP